MSKRVTTAADVQAEFEAREGEIANQRRLAAVSAEIAMHSRHLEAERAEDEALEAATPGADFDAKLAARAMGQAVRAAEALELERAAATRQHWPITETTVELPQIGPNGGQLCIVVPGGELVPIAPYGPGHPQYEIAKAIQDDRLEEAKREWIEYDRAQHHQGKPQAVPEPAAAVATAPDGKLTQEGTSAR